MANPKHFHIFLNEGSEVWDQWRAAHPKLRLDLSGVDLSEINGEISLAAAEAGAGIMGLDYFGTNFRSVNFTGANLTGTLFSGADFTKADLTRAILQADLDDANLREAILIETDLNGADLSGADFTGAILGWTKFQNNDLSTVKGLDSVKHLGPSIIDIHTIYRSKGKISETFLRGAGVSDSFIEFNRLLTGKPYRYYSCFISYSGRDEKFAHKLYADLQNAGVRCWFAPHDLRIGAKIRVALYDAVRVHEKLLLLLSKHSVSSDWVEQEVEAALTRERQLKKLFLFPIRLDNAVMAAESGWPALIRDTRNIGDFSRWRNQESYQMAFDRLLRDLRVPEET